MRPQPQHEIRMPKSNWLRRLQPLIYIAFALAFLADVIRPHTLAFGVFYLPLVCTALLDRERRKVWWLSGIAIVLVVAGTFLPMVHPDILNLIGNRALSIIAILATALLVAHAQEIQACLA